jgi:hypothetical protein
MPETARLLPRLITPSVLTLQLRRRVEKGADSSFLDLGRGGHILDFNGLFREDLGQGPQQGFDRGQMTGRPEGQRDAFLTVGDEQPAPPGRLLVELILPVDDQ